QRRGTVSLRARLQPCHLRTGQSPFLSAEGRSEARRAQRRNCFPGCWQRCLQETVHPDPATKVEVSPQPECHFKREQFRRYATLHSRLRQRGRVPCLRLYGTAEAVPLTKLSLL